MSLVFGRRVWKWEGAVDMLGVGEEVWRHRNIVRSSWGSGWIGYFACVEVGANWRYECKYDVIMVIMIK